ncbi:MAG TPA: hypothetical protein VGN72_14075 [Tepidisphaeraceae bacterium]|jgi:hypothetical protein|nr:hypothetical protein [Tepidisphaeraceae bacterium]
MSKTRAFVLIGSGVGLFVAGIGVGATALRPTDDGGGFGAMPQAQRVPDANAGASATVYSAVLADY